MQRFNGRVAIVVGGTSGIGSAAARSLAEEGAAVVIAGRRVELGTALAKELQTRGHEVSFVQTDVRSADSVAHMVDSTVARYGRLDIAVNNAGVAGSSHPIAEYPEADWDLVLSVNLKGMWLCMKYEIPHLLRAGGGAIVNTSSDVGFVGSSFGIAPYVASKHGVVGLTRAAALEYAASLIRVNAVCPGLTETDMLAYAREHQSEVLRQYIDSHIPMKRMAQAHEQARAILWLCSDESSFVTGHALAVDGGILAK
jgi:NAD(P)-dependent dehydrogenase (short-subunit alcohol dehydrogenase family)